MRKRLLSEIVEISTGGREANAQDLKGMLADWVRDSVEEWAASRQFPRGVVDGRCILTLEWRSDNAASRGR